MFKRVERKRKRREEEEELGLDEDTKEIMGLNDTDSDESDSDSDQESAQSDLAIGEDRDQEEDATSEDEDISEDPQISVAEALRDPIYLISLDPTLYGCVLCKGKLIKNAGMATAHKNADVHKRRLERFSLLSVDADPRDNARQLVRAIKSASHTQKVESQEPSKRALKRRVKQAAIRDKRKHHKELRAKAIAKKASRKVLADEGTRPVASSKANLSCSPAPESQNQPGKTRKKQKLESTIPTNKTRDVTAVHTKTSSNIRKSTLKSRIKRKANKSS